MSPTVIKVCDGHACKKNLSQYTFDRAAAELKIEGDEGGVSPDGKVSLEKCACQGKCAKGPTVSIEKFGSKKFHEYTSPVEIGNILKNIKK